jgi:hypothetical protein
MADACGWCMAITFDAVVKYAEWSAYGDTLYEWTLRLNRHFNRLRTPHGFALLVFVGLS